MQSDKLETVQMRAGLWNGLREFLMQMPASAWGNVPTEIVAGVIRDMLAAEVQPCQPSGPRNVEQRPGERVDPAADQAGHE